MLAKNIKQEFTYFNLENPEDLARLSDPVLALKVLLDVVIIYEIQKYPDLFPIIRVLIDRPDVNHKYLILGSTSGDLLRHSSESLAGRIIYYELGGFSLELVGTENHKSLWLCGGLPRSYLARSIQESSE